MKILSFSVHLVASVTAFQAVVPNSHSRLSTFEFSLAAFSIQENAERELGMMDEWASSTPIQRAGGFQLTTEDGNDFGVMTTEDLTEGSPVLSVPSAMILRSGRVREELEAMDASVGEAAEYLNRLGAGTEIPQFYLFLKVLTEYENGQESPYFPWLNSMPRLFYNAVSMTSFCYECLPPLVFSLSRNERVKFDNFVDALKKVNIIDPELKGDNDLVKWAFNIVYTRCWDYGNEKEIVPMADMFNHGTETEIAIRHDDEGNCMAYASKDVPAGSPLRISYGDPTNPSQLFATYGFLDETAPATFCKIMNIQPTKELLDVGYGFDKMLFFKDSGEVSPEVWDVLLYRNLEADKETQQAFYLAHMGGDEETKNAIHEHYFLETATTLKEHVDTFLTNLDELSGKADGKDVNEHPRLPLILRHNDFVRNTFLNVKSRLDPMVAGATVDV